MIGMHLPVICQLSIPKVLCSLVSQNQGPLRTVHLRCLRLAARMVCRSGVQRPQFFCLDPVLTGRKLKMEVFPTGCFFTGHLDFRTPISVFPKIGVPQNGWF